MANEKKVFENIRRKLQAGISTLPTLLGNEAVNFTKERFRFESWLDTTAVAWKPRKKSAKRNQGRKLLVDSGRLFRSIRVISKSEKRIQFGSTGVPYARVHNYGGTITRHARSETFLRNRGKRGRFRKGTTAGRGFTFRGGSFAMPQRQFLGKSQALRLRLIRVSRVAIARSLK